jgi:hypothetical protein
MRALQAALALVAILAIAVAHGGQGRLGGTAPVLLRIEGYVGPPRPGPRNLADLTLRRGETTLRFQVEEMWVLSGDLVGLDIIDEVRPYDPNMTLAGPPEVLDRLAAASPFEPLQVSGYFRRGQRILMLSSVERRKPR